MLHSVADVRCLHVTAKGIDAQMTTKGCYESRVVKVISCFARNSNKRPSAQQMNHVLKNNARHNTT